MVGVDVDEARAEVRRAAARGPQQDRRGRPGPGGAEAPAGAAPYQEGQRTAALPDLRDPRYALERETLKLVVQHPLAVGAMAADVDAHDFVHPTYRAVWEAVAALGGPAAAAQNEPWASRLREKVADEAAAQALHQLAVEPLLANKDPDAAYVAAHVYRLQEVTALRRITEVKSRLQRTNPVDHATEYNRMFGELVALEQQRRTLRDRAIGGEG
jgi:DNA primase